MLENSAFRMPARDPPNEILGPEFHSIEHSKGAENGHPHGNQTKAAHGNSSGDCMESNWI